MAVHRDQAHDRGGLRAVAVGPVSGASGHAPLIPPGTVAELFGTVPRSLSRLATTCLRAVLHRYRKRRTAAVLRSLDNRTLKDIGIGRCEIMAIASGTDRDLRRHRHADD